MTQHLRSPALRDELCITRHAKVGDIYTIYAPKRVRAYRAAEGCDAVCPTSVTINPLAGSIRYFAAIVTLSTACDAGYT